MPGRSPSTPVLVALGVVLVLGGVLAAVLMGPFAAGMAPVAPAASAPAAPAAAPGLGAPSGAVAPAPVDASSELQAQRTEDLPAVDALVGMWVPQLSSKRVGDEAEGQVWDPAAVLAEHRDLRAQYPDARLVWSGDFGSFADGDFWITLLADPSSTAEGANAWCDSAGFDGDHCYAKRLATSGGPDGNTVLREDTAASGGAVGSGAEPVVGDAGWAPGVVGFGTVRPDELNANGNGTSYIEEISWDSWGGPVATGNGLANWMPADGIAAHDAVMTPAVVVASDLGDCNGTLGYRSVAWYFPSKGDTAPAPGDGYDDVCTPF